MPLHTGVRTGFHYSIRAYIWCVLREQQSVFFFCISEVRDELHAAPLYKLDVYSAGRAWTNARNFFSWNAVSRLLRLPSAVGLVVCFSFFAFDRTRPTASRRPLWLIYLSTSLHVVICHRRRTRELHTFLFSISFYERVDAPILYRYLSFVILSSRLQQYSCC